MQPPQLPPGSTSVMLDTVSIVLTPLVTMYMYMEGCGRAHHRLLHRLANLSRESGKVTEREVPPNKSFTTPFSPTTPNTDVLVKTVLVRIKCHLRSGRDNKSHV